MIHHILTVVLLTPCAGAVLLLVVPRRREAAVQAIAAAAATAGCAASLPLWFRFDPASPGWQFAERAPLFPSFGASYYLGVDGFSALMVLLTTVLGVVVTVSSSTVPKGRMKEHSICLLVLQSATLGVFMSLDLLLLFVFWEVMLVAMAFLIGRRFFFYAAGGSAAVLAGILGLYFAGHSATAMYTFDVTRLQQLSVPLAAQKWMFVSLFLGFATPAALFPMHSWLPAAQADVPMPGFMMLAAIVLRTGAYAFVSVSLPILPEASRYFAAAVGWLSLVAIVYGAVGALAQSDWKRLLAFYCIGSIGLMTLGLFSLSQAGIAGSLVQQITHGIPVGALLWLAGMLHVRPGTEGAAHASLFEAKPVFGIMFLIAALSASGMPPLSGFVGARLTVRGVLAGSRLQAGVAVIGLVLVAVSILRLSLRTLSGRGGVDGEGFGGVRARDLAVLLLLIAGSVWIGVYPAPVLQRLDRTVTRVMARVNPPPAPVEKSCDTPPAAAPTPATPTAPPNFITFASCDENAAKPARPPAVKKKPGSR